MARRGNLLFIVDPQVDFHEGGSLAVPGAAKDSERIAGLIREMKFETIMVTLDTHQYVDIGHAIWWRNEEKEQPKPFSTITHEDMVKKKWMTARREDQDWSMNYLSKLEKNNRYQHTIWPYHCIIGTKGHGIVPSINEALEEWAKKNKQLVHFMWKGTNPKAEMYSAFKADVEVPGADETKLNKQVLDRIFRYQNIVLCGQAKSHCVMYSLIDMIDYFDTKKGKKPELILLSDCTSPVTGFEKQTETGYDNLTERCKYLRVIKSEDLKIDDLKG